MSEYSQSLASDSKESAKNSTDSDQDMDNIQLEVSEKILNQTKSGNSTDKIQFWIQNDPDYKKNQLLKQEQAQ